MRTLEVAIIALTGLSLSACSQISNTFKKKPHYHTNDGTVVYTGSEASLRSSPVQSYEFAKQSYDVEIYDAASQYDTSPHYYDSTSQYAGYGVELYGSQTAYGHSFVQTDPREAEFVKLNGSSETMDWQNCETHHKGYLFLSEYDFSLNPGFEVCMRNKGYVLSSEAGPTSKQKLSAKTAGLRGFSQPYVQPYPEPKPSGYIQPNYTHSSDLDFLR